MPDIDENEYAVEIDPDEILSFEGLTVYKGPPCLTRHDRDDG